MRNSNSITLRRAHKQRTSMTSGEAFTDDLGGEG